MYSKFINDFNASIEALRYEKIAFSEIVNRYIANQKDFSNRVFEAWRDRVLSDVELDTIRKYFGDETERAATQHLNHAVNESYE